jgi:flagellin
MIINNNPVANRSYIPYTSNLKNLERSASRLATGDKFANAADGTGTLAVSDRLKLAVVGTNAMKSGMQNALGYAQTQDDILGQVSEVIARMKELASSAVDTTKTAADRTALNAEFRALDLEVQSLAANSKYNGTRLFETASTIRVGLETTDLVSFSSIELSGLTFVTLSLNSTTDASAAITTLDTRLGSLNAMRVKSRAQHLRVERALTVAQSYAANLENARSTIRDVDLATETANFTKSQVIVSASQAVLAQANSLPQSALQFLQF